MRKHRETKKRTSGFRKNKRKNKEAKKTLCKKENVEKVFWSGNSEEIKKGSVQMSQHKFSKEKKSFLMEKKTGRRRKHKGIFRPFKKIKKWKQMGTTFFSKKICKKCFFLKTIFITFFLLKKEYVEREKQKNNQIDENLEKEKQKKNSHWRKRKKVSVQKHVRF